ncbi:MAG TPA: M1 family aminopeptidase [Candidatus Saccharimonadales bacterium]|nr:M1 family aminopeptidase [Candidatus Saccharimonadales bacterium]
MSKVTRLLEAVRPSRYHLNLEPDLENFTFSGHETIEFEHLAGANSLTFHSLELDISRCQLTAAGRKHTPTRTSYHKDDQTVTFHFDQPLPTGALKLQLDFIGKLRDELHGFYRSRYELDGQSHYLATTQFEATSAREAFVVIDEPAAKAVFETTLVIPPDLTAVSNTDPAGQKTRSDGKRVVKFAPTPKMSSYLLAFLVGRFESVETKTKQGVTVRVLVTPGKRHQAAFALEVAAKTLSFYGDYFGIAYPLPKLDMIAVPDFAIGAMENWGAVTYRETAILVDPDNSALANKQWAAMVIAHELAHQWFGNLVTMAWWTDLWLNEGFASWIEYLAVDHLFPEWNMWTQFVTHDYQQARELDSLANTHPIEVEVDNPAEIDEIFDAISYQKGASVIRMLYHFLGEADFKRGLHNYLAAYSYNNARTADLWQHLAEASGKPVQKLMGAWTSQPGFPVVEVASSPSTPLRTGEEPFDAAQDKPFDAAQDKPLDAAQDKPGVSLKQRRFYANPKASAKDPTIWPIPIQAITPSGLSEQILFDTQTTSYELRTTNTWLKVNPGQTGFYITRYDPASLAQLRTPLANQALAPTDRLGLVGDSFSLVRAGEVGSEAALEMTKALRSETDYAVWISLLSGLGGFLSITAEHEDLHRQLEQFGLWLTGPTLQRLGWQTQNQESHFDQLLRPVIIRSAGRFGDEAVMAQSRQRLEEHLGGSLIEPDLRSAVYCTVARYGTDSDYDQLLKLYREAKLQEEKRRLMNALGLFQKPELVQKTLQFMLSDEVRSQDSVFGILNVLGNRHGRIMAWQFIKDQWPLLKERYAQGMTLSRIPQGLGDVFASHKMADEIESFFARNMVPSVQRSVKQCLEQIRLQADWYQRDEGKIKTFLGQFKPE